MSEYYDRDKDGSAGFEKAQPKMQWPRPHFGSVPEYQVSSWPYIANVTSGVTDELVDFGFVTRWITVHAIGVACTISFASSGLEFTVPPGELVRLELKCTKMYVTTTTGTCSIIAGLTAAHERQFPDISERDGVKAP